MTGAGFFCAQTGVEMVTAEQEVAEITAFSHEMFGEIRVTDKDGADKVTTMFEEYMQ